MMRRKVIVVVVVGLLVSGLAGEALASKPPGRSGPEPRPRLWGGPEWGDPDWPAYSNFFGIERRVVWGEADETAQSAGTAAQQNRSKSIRPVRKMERSPYRRHEERVLRLTIAIGR